MDKKVIDNIVWWIPFKKLRNSVRELLLYNIEIGNLHNNINTKINNLENLCGKINYDLSNIEEIIIKKYSKENIIYPVKLLNDNYYFYDTITSKTVSYVTSEINGNEYSNMFNIDFKEGDIVIDIGANIGMVSILLAKKFPFIKIYSFEPVKTNYDNFVKNIKINEVTDGIIKHFNKAVTKDGREISMIVNPINQGNSYINIYNTNYNLELNVESLTFTDILNENNIDKIKLLKIDCEGSEYEILYNINKSILTNIEYIYGEFHSKGGL